MDADFSIRQVGVYRQEQHYRGRIGFDGISLNISGLRAFSYGTVEQHAPGPFFLIALRDWSSDFDYGPERENWVMIFNSAVFRSTTKDDYAEFMDDGQWLQVPLLTPVPTEQVPRWRQQMIRLREAVASPTPQNRFIAHALLLEVLRFILEAGKPVAVGSPAARLKELIDLDTGFVRPLKELGRECGYSNDHLRVLFTETYKMQPGEYRAQRRLVLAFDLLGNSQLTIKEVGVRLGFEQTSAFSAFVRKMTGRSATEIRRSSRFE